MTRTTQLLHRPEAGKSEARRVTRLDPENRGAGRLAEVQPKAEPDRHQRHRNGKSEQHSEQKPSLQCTGRHRLQIVDEARNQVIGHCLPPNRASNALKPRCTATFTADSDMPVAAATSATDCPSIFTRRINPRVRSGRASSMASRSWQSSVDCAETVSS